MAHSSCFLPSSIFSMGMISISLRARITSIPINESYPRGFLCTTSTLTSALLPSYVQTETTVTQQNTWDMPSIILISTCHLLLARLWFAVTMECEHPISIRAEHLMASTCTLITGKALFTDWKGTKVVTVPCSRTHFLNRIKPHALVQYFGNNTCHTF